MSTSKHINKICIAGIIVTLILTVLFMCGKDLGITAVSKAMKYESTLFDTSYVHQLDIVMDDWDAFIETCENEEYSYCTVLVDGKKYANTAIRAKGNTSLSSVKSAGSQRYSFKLEFDHYEDAKMMDGLDKLCLNNLIQDNTMMKDYIVYRLMSDFGVDSPLCSFAYLTVNGQDWGLYLAVEGIEDSFLHRTYGSNSGELYKPDSLSFGGGRGNGRDFDFNNLDFDFGFNFDFGKKDEGTDQSSNPSEQKTPGGFTPGQDGNGGDNGFPGGFTPSQDGNGGNQGFPGGQTPGGTGDESSSGGGGDEGRQDGQTPGGNMPDGSGQGFPGGFTPGQDDNGSNQGLPGGQTPGGNGMPGGFGGMGSDDVKLKYIDDDPKSYSNIFGSAKTDVSDSDQKRLIESLKKLSAYEDLEKVLDMDEVLRYFVVHNFVCNGDSYTGSMIHNYYLHEAGGKLAMIPWDYNLAYGTFQGGDAVSTVNSSIDSPVNGDMNERPMIGWIFSDEEYTEMYHELFKEFIEKWFTNGELEKLIADTAEMIRPYVEKDPTKFCTTEEFEKGVEALSEFCSLRGEAVSRQLEGDNTVVATGSLNLSDMGTMGSTGGAGLPSGKDRKEDGEQATLDQTTPDQNAPSESAPAETGSGEESSSGGGGITPGGDGQTPGGFTPGGDSGFPGGGDRPSAGGKGLSSEAKLWLLSGISALVLVIGIIIAAKKKSTSGL